MRGIHPLIINSNCIFFKVGLEIDESHTIDIPNEIDSSVSIFSLYLF